MPLWEGIWGHPLVRGVNRQKVSGSDFFRRLLLAANSISAAGSNQVFPGFDFEPLPFSGVIRSVTHQVLAKRRRCFQRPPLRPIRLGGSRKQSVPARVHSVLKICGFIGDRRRCPTSDGLTGRSNHPTKSGDSWVRSIHLTFERRIPEFLRFFPWQTMRWGFEAKATFSGGRSPAKVSRGSRRIRGGEPNRRGRLSRMSLVPIRLSTPPHRKEKSKKHAAPKQRPLTRLGDIGRNNDRPREVCYGMHIAGDVPQIVR